MDPATIKKRFTEYNNNSQIKKMLARGACPGEHDTRAEILVTGLNPSLDPKREGTYFGFKLKDADEKIGYFKNIKTMLGRYLPLSAYLDLFPVKCSSQREFLKTIDLDLPFFASLLSETQSEIERTAPRLIIVNNRAAQAFWGAKKNCVWMGYRFERIAFPDKNIDVRRIVGFREGPESESVRQTAGRKTNLQNSIIVFYALYDDRHKVRYSDRMLCEDDIGALLSLAK